jgi:hypothetical protein
MADWSKTKYNCLGTYRFAQLIDLKSLVPYNQVLSTKALKCILAAYSRSTWAKYYSALNAFNKFEKAVGAKFEWPLQEEVYRGFVTWCITVRNLSSSTAKAYINAPSNCTQHSRSLKCRHKTAEVDAPHPGRGQQHGKNKQQEFQHQKIDEFDGAENLRPQGGYE